MLFKGAKTKSWYHQKKNRGGEGKKSIPTTTSTTHEYCCCCCYYTPIQPFFFFFFFHRQAASARLVYVCFLCSSTTYSCSRSCCQVYVSLFLLTFPAIFGPLSLPALGTGRGGQAAASRPSACQSASQPAEERRRKGSECEKQPVGGGPGHFCAFIACVRTHTV